jgi:GH25 family lysozyme M1 (1,4-beta-N-acetylmuramidase)
MWQHPNNKPINFVKLKSKYGVSFVFIKASDGGNRDSGKSANWFKVDGTAARAAGLIVGPYHYSVPGQTGSGMMIVLSSMKSKSNYNSLVATALSNRKRDAILQARQAYKNAQNNPRGDLPMTLDFEERPCGWSWTNVSAWTRDFLVEAKRLSGRTPIIYANGYFINKLVSHPVKDVTNPTRNFDFSVYPLWKASWSRSIATAPSTAPIWGSKWAFWQFTSDGALKDHKTKPTVPSFRTDLDVFNGTLTELRAFANR